MFHLHLNNLTLLPIPKRWWRPCLSDPAMQMVGDTSNVAVCSQGLQERIRQMFLNVELSVSSYDTAWVAMVPSLNSSQFPCFPECLNWVLENQLTDGSWGFPHRHSLLTKDALSSTLACVLALKRWNVGEEHVEKGLDFIGSKISSAIDEEQHSPIGFNFIFTGMIEYAEELGLNLPLSSNVVDGMFHKREVEFQRCSRSDSKGSKAYLAYVAEGLGKLQDWQEVMKYQRKNGSLFNSPSTTAAALIHLKDDKCLEYLHSVLKSFGNAVPTAYPLDKYTQLCVVDSLEKLGIARHFISEIRKILDDTYRCWLQCDEEICLDISTCALAYRLLRMNGYDISSDALVQFAEEDFFFNLLGGNIMDLGTLLELFRASQILTSSDQWIFEKLNSLSSHNLKQELSKLTKREDRFWKDIAQEVDYALKIPFYANLERLHHRKNIENYSIHDFKILKTSYRSRNIDKISILELAVEDFKACQSIHQKELEHLDRWVKENQLDQLNFARQKLTYCYFSAAATIFSPELSDARISWAKNSVLTTVVDDFYDIGGSREELVNLIHLVEKWGESSTADCCSEQVQIIFSAIYNTVIELGKKASTWQGHSITHHLIEIWLALLKSMMREAQWQLDKLVPTMDEYMTNGYVSFALGPIVLPALYFVGPNLPEEVVRGSEYHTLYKLMSTCGRLLNDMQGFKDLSTKQIIGEGHAVDGLYFLDTRPAASSEACATSSSDDREGKEGKLNSISLRMVHGNGAVTEEDAVRETENLIDSTRGELLRMVLQTKGSVIPGECKDLFWKMSKILHLFYMRNDGFTSPREMASAVNAVIHEPLNPPPIDC